MHDRKFISFVTAFAMIITSFTQIIFPGGTTAKAATYIETDYIGSSESAETFDNYVINTTGGVSWTFPTPVATNASSSLEVSTMNPTATEYPLPTVGATVQPDSGANPLYPAYVSGKTLRAKVSSGISWQLETVAVGKLNTVMTEGKVTFISDIGFQSNYSNVFRGGAVILKASDETEVLKVNIPDKDKNGNYTITANATGYKTNKYVSTRKANPDGIHVEITVDLDKKTADFSIDYIAQDNIRYIDTYTGMAISGDDIAEIDLQTSGMPDKRQFEVTMLDNTQFYAKTVRDRAKTIDVTYTSDGTKIKTETIDIDGDYSAGESYTYTLPAYTVNDGKLYKITSDTETGYSRTVGLVKDTTSVYETVTALDGECTFTDFDDTAVVNPNFASGGKGTACADELPVATISSAGTYTVCAGTAVTSSTDTGISGDLLLNGTSVGTITFANTPTECTISGLPLDANDVLSVQGSDGAAVDYVVIQKTSDTVSFTEPTKSTASAKKMEDLGRGIVAVKVADGVFISWRLLGTESLSNQAFDIYRDDELIYTTGVHEATNYVDTSGAETNTYTVVPAGTDKSTGTAVTPITNKFEYTNGSNYNAEGYIEIPLVVPTWLPARGEESTATPEPETDSGEEDTDASDDATPAPTATSTPYVGYTANDCSAGDLDGDGEYELVVKWNPSNAVDSASSGYTSPTLLEAYELDGKRLWSQPINLGYNIRSGPHYTQFMVYDLDNDGIAEIVTKTAPGSADGNGEYVSAVGNTSEIRQTDNTANYLTTSGRIQSGPEYLTVFNRKTGAAMQTIDFYPAYGDVTKDEWGDDYGNRADRYLAAVAYLDGENPSVIFDRGYYKAAFVAAYDWDGVNLTRRWLNQSRTSKSYSVTDKDGNETSYTNAVSSLYGQGNHSLSVCDADSDGKDEVVFGSAVIDDDGTVLNSTGRGHGDAIHVSDFNNDGAQEIFQVHEASPYGFDFRKAKNAADITYVTSSDDNARGVMANIADGDERAIGWSSGITGTLYFANGSSYDLTKGTDYVFPNTRSNNYTYNSVIYWDGKLDRELLDGTVIQSYRRGRFYANKSSGYTLYGCSSNNDSKANACLSADLFGDWREEVVMRYGYDTLRVFTSAIPTDYRLYTLMHDPQYRCAIAWQNAGYNQPPHTSYYIGSAALAQSGGVTMNYLDPKTAYSKVETVTANSNPVTVSIESEPVATENALIYTNTIKVPSDVTVSSDNVSVTINGTETTKADSFAKKITNITGGSVTFTSAITDIPADDPDALEAAKTAIFRTTVTYTDSSNTERKATATN